ncbi:hypothetical protein DVA86_20560 [Streptomyces armeniacus]|uniref:Uncharacterized protein n=1 Tax=Streptomyces armeniacus TaxID=83291 RepID=A0A345XSS1_9ACTN|nr:hypothetical protein [Streptomyces armeniacus]AXK34687.1 hypothetical protein DVA86_20560 [Streptomyces armeniacus]
MNTHAISFLFALACTVSVALALEKAGAPLAVRIAAAVVLFPTVAWAHHGVLRDAIEHRSRR